MAGILGKIFGSPIFTWWNSPTVGTRLFTKRNGVKVGEDGQGNVYYKAKEGRKRWVIYNGPVEASRVPAEWHGWLHYTVDTPPSEKMPEIQDWEQEHVPNLTGTVGAYFPSGSLNASGERAKTASDYQSWTPGT